MPIFSFSFVIPVNNITENEIELRINHQLVLVNWRNSYGSGSGSSSNSSSGASSNPGSLKSPLYKKKRTHKEHFPRQSSSIKKHFAFISCLLKHFSACKKKRIFGLVVWRNKALSCFFFLLILSYTTHTLLWNITGYPAAVKSIGAQIKANCRIFHGTCNRW